MTPLSFVATSGESQHKRELCLVLLGEQSLFGVIMTSKPSFILCHSLCLCCSCLITVKVRHTSHAHVPERRGSLSLPLLRPNCEPLLAVVPRALEKGQREKVDLKAHPLFPVSLPFSYFRTGSKEGGGRKEKEQERQQRKGKGGRDREKTASKGERVILQE